MKTAAGFFFWLIMLSSFSIFAQMTDDDGQILYFSAYAPGQNLSGNSNNGTWNHISRSKGIPGISDSAFYFNGFVSPKPEDAFEKTDHFETGRYVLSHLDSSGRNATPAEVVEILAVEPIWKQSWFIPCSILGTFLLTFLLVHWYDSNLQQEQVFEFEKSRMLERERFRIAREMQDEIGSGLNTINLLTEIALNKSKEPQVAAEIEHIAAAARDVHARIQDIIWTINAQNDTLVSLLQHLEQFTNGLLATGGIVLQFDMPANIAVQTIPGDLRRALFLAYKEALNNIVRHAHATQVNIGISIPGKQLVISICDNGCGFDPLAAGNLGNGLFNMRRRMEDAGGVFRIKSGDNGTDIVLNIQVD